MENITRLVLCAICLCVSVSAQTRIRPMLGEADYSGPGRLTPRYGIRYFSRGFDRVKLKVTAKTDKWLARHGAGELIPKFHLVAYDAHNMAAWFDEANEEVDGKWLACGGIWRETVLRNPARNLTVLVEAAPFFVSGYDKPVSGTVEGNVIRVVISNVRWDGIWLQTAKALYAYERGNHLMLAAKTWDGTKDGEIGSASPCGRN